MLLVALLVAVGCLWWNAADDVVPEVARPGEAESAQVLAAEQASVDRVSLHVGEEAEGRRPARSDLSKWTLRVLAIDQRGEPVVGLEVTAGSGVGYDDLWNRTGLGKGTRSDARTDSQGRASLAVLGPLAFVQWQAGESHMWLVAEQSKEADSELILACYGPVLVPGIVRGADGSPVPDATVEIDDSSKRETVQAGADGRFQVPLLLSRGYQLRAMVDGKWTPSAKVFPTGDADGEVVLRPRGADVASIQGLVLTAAGEPAVDGTVFALSEETGKRRRVYTVRGEFRIGLTEFEAFHVSVKAPGAGSSHSVRIEPTPVAPHLKTTLRLTELQFLRGRAVDPEGNPIAGAQVRAGSPRPGKGRWRVVDNPETVRTDDKGCFEIPVSPAVDWSVQAYVSQRELMLRGEVEGVRSGAQDVQLVMRSVEERQAKAAVRAVQVAVTRRGGGEPGRCLVEPWQVTIVAGERHLIGGLHGPGYQAKVLESVAGKPAKMSPLPVDREIWLRVRPEDPELAFFDFGPIPAGAGPLDLHIELSEWAVVPIRVLDAMGKPMPACSVFVRSLNGMPSECTRYTDRSGCATLYRLPPGRRDLIVVHPGSPKITQTVDLLPGRNGAMVVRFP